MNKITSIAITFSVALAIMSGVALADHNNHCCNPHWNTGSWTSCVNGHQTRTVFDTNHCGTNEGKPSTIRSCLVPVPTPTPTPSPTPNPVNNTTNNTIGNSTNTTVGNSTNNNQTVNVATGVSTDSSMGARLPDYGALLPNSNTDKCILNTFMSYQCRPSYVGTLSCKLPKQLFIICLKNTTEDYKNTFMSNPFGIYGKSSEWINYKYAFSWWKLRL